MVITHTVHIRQIEVRFEKKKIHEKNEKVEKSIHSLEMNESGFVAQSGGSTPAQCKKMKTHTTGGMHMFCSFGMR